MIKPYFVKISYTAVILAVSERSAINLASHFADDISADNVCAVEAVTVLEDLEQLQRLNPEIDVDESPYGGGQGSTKSIKDILEA